MSYNPLLDRCMKALYFRGSWSRIIFIFCRCFYCRSFPHLFFSIWPRELLKMRNHVSLRSSCRFRLCCENSSVSFLSLRRDWQAISVFTLFDESLRASRRRAERRLQSINIQLRRRCTSTPGFNYTFDAQLVSATAAGNDAVRRCEHLPWWRPALITIESQRLHIGSLYTPCSGIWGKLPLPTDSSSGTWFRLVGVFNGSQLTQWPVQWWSCN